MSTPVVATCTCTNFTFKSSRAPILQLSCHCQQCRDASKAAFTNFAFFKLGDAEVSGATSALEFTADSGAQTRREFCATCGDMVLDRTAGFPQIVGVVAERIRPPFEFQARCHVWLDSKLPSVTVAQGIKTHARGMA